MERNKSDEELIQKTDLAIAELVYDKDDLQKKYNIISKAIQEQNILTFKFHNKERRFQPFSFTYYKDFIYITGYSIDENDIKTLNLSGIDDLKM